MAPESFLVDTMYHADGFANVEPRLHPWDESHLVMMDNPFNVLLHPFSSANFGIYIHQGYQSIILVFEGVFA